MTDIKTPPVTPMTRKLAKRMVEVEEKLKDVLKGTASEYVIEIKIRKIPESEAFSPINEVTLIEDVQERVSNETFLDKTYFLPMKEVIPQKLDVASELPKADVASAIPADSQQEDISPESSLALALIEKGIIPSCRKLRRNGNRRSIKIKKFGSVSTAHTVSVESENKVSQESKPSDLIQEQSEIIPNPFNLIAEDPEILSASQDIVSDSIEAISSPINISPEPVEVVSEPFEVISVPIDDLSEHGEALNSQIVGSEPMEDVLEPHEIVSESVENESECDDVISDAEDVIFSEDLTPDLFRSNIRSELAELAMELIGSEPALEDLALRLGTQETSPESQSDLVSTPYLPDLAEDKPIKTKIEQLEVIAELSPENHLNYY